jgi:molybdopterin-guanine dinucleotide biosynthesis protein A
VPAAVDPPASGPPAPLLGVLAGGHGERMGGRDKAALLAPGGGETLLARLLRLGRAAGLQVVVVGGRGVPGVPRLDDDPAAVGPIGGLCALLSHARDRPAIALACDLPYASAELIAKLARMPCRAPVLAPRDAETGKWQPLFARYDSPRVLPALRAAIATGTRSFQTFLRAVDVQELSLDAGERRQLRDWDTPADLEP